MSDFDYYELLEVERTADGKTIKSSYRRLAMRYHPDRNPGDREAEERFKAISEAYDCLKDPQKRAAYDRFGKAAFQGGGAGPGAQDFSGFSDIFESVFGEFMGGRGQSRSSVQRGADLRYDLEINLEEAFKGKSVDIELDVAATCEACHGSGAKADSGRKVCQTCHGSGRIRVQQGFFVVEQSCPVCHGKGEVISDPCPECHGEGRLEKHKTLSVNIPAGVDDGTRIRLSGEGEAGAHGGPAGDLYIFIHVIPHQVFQRENYNLFAHVPISFTKAALGGSIHVPSLDGEQHEIDIPAGIQSGKQLRRRGAGMPVLNGRGRGDLIVQIDVETPTHLTVKQRELLEQFRETETGEECPKSSGFFARIKNMLTGE
ncbi:molecular chaperone DnaJ [Zymomonas mobilis]|uniref:Chaperone protein DnaJ n=1 Tax=Zymomonas mobilis subsp. pomaceae (strain ATCC 29192 / DSM 22645 / JCM 10191 / CCUG 17912 / NBRC 13757 / NCIMB 11200 / NRRL B-4491 / Barker I) TaxID=579138 RepID=F8ERL3_ZYMMT|nr:molecular chaperone DnaJ [Zymomonas mobilis]AEI37471.1 chaperone protein DnaJ [Zymomonas mobilis subsp. pomaceae ATCC 29192]MDX5948838.1 molecular chaperone DnaJ [Zymomonas mobilis subsp. pomaceae]GEB88646.1 chaperone protein DnaJ [Zymomonas mobilis subsp. pomaceae]